MKLSEVFDQVEVTIEQAQAMLTALVTNLRDGNPELYESVMDSAANLQEPAVEPENTTTTTSTLQPRA